MADVRTTGRVREKAARAAKTTFAVVLGELRFVVGTFGRAFVRAGAVVTLLTFAVFTASYLVDVARGDDLARGSIFAHVVLAVIIVGYSLLTGAQGGLVFAIPWTAWKLAGAWIVVPLVVIPISVVLGFVICSPLTGVAGSALVDAIIEAGGAHHWLIGDLGPVARAGPIALVFAIPLLVIDLGAVMLAPQVLLHLAVLILALAFALLLGLVPSGLISLFAITIGYTRRFMRRHGETVAGRGSERSSPELEGRSGG